MTATKRRRTAGIIALLLATPAALLASGQVSAAAAGGHTRERSHVATSAAVRSAPVSPAHNSTPPRGFGSSLVGVAPAGIGSSAIAVDPTTRTIYVANGNNPNGPSAGGNTVSVIDGRRCNASAVQGCAGPWPTVTVGNEPSTLTVDPATHTIYVTNIDDNTVSVIDGRTCNGNDSSGCGQSPTTVPVGAAPLGVYADDATHTIYVGNFADNTVSLIDSTSCNGAHASTCPTTSPPAVAVGSGPGDVDINQRTHTAYVTTLTGLTAFDTRTCNATTQAGCGQTGEFTLCPPDSCIGSFSAKVDEANNTIYEGDGNISIAAIDGRECDAGRLAGCATASFGRVTLAAAGFDHVLFLAVDAPAHTVYAVTHKDDAVVVIDANVCNGAHPAGCAGLSTPEIHTGANPESIALDPRTHTLYTANEVDNTVSVIDASRCSAGVRLGCRPRPPSSTVPGAGQIAVDPAVHTAYVTSDAQNVAMIDTTQCTAGHPGGCARRPTTVGVEGFPISVAVNQATHTIYVATAAADGTGSVVVLDARHCHAGSTGCAPTATLRAPAGVPTGIAINSVSDTIYVGIGTGTGSNLVAVFNGATCNASTTAGCGQAPDRMLVGDTDGCSFVAVAVNEVTNTVYATNTGQCSIPYTGDTVYVYDGSTCDATHRAGCRAAKATIAAGFNPLALTVDSATDTVYAPLLADGEHAGYVAVIQGASCNGSNTSGCGRTPALAPVGFGATAAAIDPLTHLVYVTSVQDTSVSVIASRHCRGADTSHCSDAPRQVSVDDYPTYVAVDPTVGTAYVTSGVKGTVTVVAL